MKHDTNLTDFTLAEHLRITEAEVADRKRMLGLTPKLEQVLAGFDKAIRECAEGLIEDFYLQQTEFTQIQSIIGDADTLKRLKASMRGYVIRLFSGNYDADYVNSRLRIGKVHARIGVAPKTYVASMHRLENHLSTVLSESYGYDPACGGALAKLMLFDLGGLVFDTYIQGLVSEVELTRDELLRHSEELEHTVRARTAEIECMAQTDDVTSLLNRRHFLKLAQGAYDKARRGGRTSLSFVFIDLERFKCVNEALGGHQEGGDRVLARTGGEIIADLLGTEGGIAARHGGGANFWILLPPRTDADGGAQDFCDALSSALPEVNGARLSARCGIAAAGGDGSYPPSLDELIAISDGALHADLNGQAPPAEADASPVVFQRSVVAAP